LSNSHASFCDKIVTKSSLCGSDYELNTTFSSNRGHRKNRNGIGRLYIVVQKKQCIISSVTEPNQKKFGGQIESTTATSME